MDMCNNMIQPNSSPWRKLNLLSSPDKQSKQNSNMIPLPSNFKFTPSKNKKLYPNLNSPSLPNSSPIKSDLNLHSDINLNLNDKSYINKENQSFINAMDTLQEQLFSSNISNKVLNEFSLRYEKIRDEKIQIVQEMNNNNTNDELNRRASGRFSATHRNKFNRMESIAFHYAAKRNENLNKLKNGTTNSNSSGNGNGNGNGNPSDINENFPISSSNVTESATKRLKIDNFVYKEIDSSPTKSLTERELLRKNYQKNTTNTKPIEFQSDTHYDTHVENEIFNNMPSYLQPTKSSLQKSSSIPKLSPSKSTKTFETLLNQNDNFKTPSVSPNKSLKSSPFSKISPSKAYSNLNKIINTPEPVKSNIEEDNHLKTSRISRSISSSYNNGQKISSITRSKTLNPVKNTIKPITGSSSIPRFTTLLETEREQTLLLKSQAQKLKLKSKDNDVPKRWKY